LSRKATFTSPSQTMAMKETQETILAEKNSFRICQYLLATLKKKLCILPNQHIETFSNVQIEYILL